MLPYVALCYLMLPYVTLCCLVLPYVTSVIESFNVIDYRFQYTINYVYLCLCNFWYVTSDFMLNNNCMLYMSTLIIL